MAAHEDIRREAAVGAGNRCIDIKFGGGFMEKTYLQPGTLHEPFSNYSYGIVVDPHPTAP